jgi:hypothetical protein
MDASNIIQNSSGKFLIYSRKCELVKFIFKFLIIFIQSYTIRCKAPSNTRGTVSTVSRSAGRTFRNLKLLSFTILELGYFHKQVDLHFIAEVQNY